MTEQKRIKDLRIEILANLKRQNEKLFQKILFNIARQKQIMKELRGR